MINITSFVSPGKNVEAAGDSLYHEIEYLGLGYLLKLFVFERDSYVYTYLTLSLRTVKSLCPNLQKSPLPGKIPGQPPAYLPPIFIEKDLPLETFDSPQFLFLCVMPL